MCIRDSHLDVLEAVRKFTDIPLVLHGCTGMRDDVIKEAIKLGVAKINFGTEIRYKYVEPVSYTHLDVYKRQIPHHYSIVWEDVAGAMKEICGLLKIPVVEF